MSDAILTVMRRSMRFFHWWRESKRYSCRLPMGSHSCTSATIVGVEM
jgi:hypothetical protein